MFNLNMRCIEIVSMSSTALKEMSFNLSMRCIEISAVTCKVALVPV